MWLKNYLKFSPEVKRALKEKQPIVALESTVIVHGLPFPDNLDVTRQMIKSIQERGCAPAVIFLDKGFIKIGLESEELEELATLSSTAQSSILKVSVADIAATLGQEAPGATTVASTLYCAQAAGIKVFATGGIGGVHRGAEENFDISADLLALKDIPVAVVAAGAKSILDIPKTLEMLETFGVPILGYNAASFPTFYCKTSAYPLIHNFKNLTPISKIITLQLKMQKGALIANPIPSQAALEEKDVENWISQALNLAEENEIKGKAVTPFLLKKLTEYSKGKTLEANKALLLNNAQVAAELARLLH